MRSRLAAALLFVIAACSSKSSGPSTAAFNDVDVAAHDANPDGVAYPTDDIGPNQRVTGRYGQRIPNLTFQGYPASDKAGGLKTISLADYYDPQNKRYKLLHVMLAGSWCTICQGQTKEMVPEMPELGQQGLVTVQALVNGPAVGYGPQLVDLDAWIDKHKTPYTMVIDVQAHRFRGIWSFDGIPVNALVDPRSMEILAVGVGAPNDFKAYVAAGFKALDVPPKQ